ncbi:hypothetical protein [Ktedonospora formicarum]|uniref:Uncharacterized protein n=1 Tax=Ktedonospora formicarum TaxID=2778364 RepID=A0A8J3MSR5_9CHLR|nr:hypothetical protein [Ktedonospora formicarum]GHO47367.1 hypothetical protein KSX_55300 [Ktedonospora formicarum]
MAKHRVHIEAFFDPKDVLIFEVSIPTTEEDGNELRDTCYFQVKKHGWRHELVCRTMVNHEAQTAFQVDIHSGRNRYRPEDTGRVWLPWHSQRS